MVTNKSSVFFYLIKYPSNHTFEKRWSKLKAMILGIIINISAPLTMQKHIIHPFTITAPFTRTPFRALRAHPLQAEKSLEVTNSYIYVQKKKQTHISITKSRIIKLTTCLSNNTTIIFVFISYLKSLLDTT